MRAVATARDSTLRSVAEALAPSGLILRGGFNFRADDDVPAMVDGQPAGAVALVGTAGAGHWRVFEAWRAEQPLDLAHPLDSWSRAVIGAIAERFGATAIAPSDKPYQPFQQWGMRAEGVRPSPLGILIHPRYGLWHAYRGALLFDHPLAWDENPAASHPCDACEGMPCLNACPVDAHGIDGFDYAGCMTHVRGDHGELCRTMGCFSRNACPVGTAFRYPPAVQAFHMAAFAKIAAS